MSTRAGFFLTWIYVSVGGEGELRLVGLLEDAGGPDNMVPSSIA